MKSSSGGIFCLLANNILKDKGIVIGASFNEKQVLNHVKGISKWVIKPSN